MSNQIDILVSQKNYDEVLLECVKDKKYNLGILISKILSEKNNSPNFYKLCDTLENSRKQYSELSDNTKYIRIMLYCNWLSSRDLCNCWNKMSKGNYTWNKIKIVWEEPADYYVVINAPPKDVEINKKKTIIFQMEPLMKLKTHIWGEWANPNKDDFLHIFYNGQDYNNNEWHLSKTYSQLMNEPVQKDESISKCLSTVLSNKYVDPGHIKRIDFSKFLETKDIDLHVFGGNKFEWKNYKGYLPIYCKDNAMFPYKYGFNVENHSIPNYYTEKLIDGILSETLIFYNGASNIRELIDPESFVWLELSNFEEDYKKIKRAIEEDWWSQRIDIIRKEKKRILEQLQFFPRLENFISSINK